MAIIKIPPKIILIFVFVFFVSGCGSDFRKTKVVITGSDSRNGFPESLAGKWEAVVEKPVFSVTLNADGSIHSAVIPLGAVEMFPGKTSRFKTKYGGKGIFKPGPWKLYYDTDTKDLLVEIVIEDFYQDLGPHALKGNITDIFMGEVDIENGEWTADWFSYGKYTALLPEPNEFYNSPEPEYRRSVIFKKVVDVDADDDK